MTKKFDPKNYLNKKRIYRPVQGAPRVLRLWIWDEDKLQYAPPEQGKCYEARRYEVDDGGIRVRKKQYFETLDAARAWQAGKEDLRPNQIPSLPVIEVPKPIGLTFGELVQKWKQRRFPQLQESTRISYEKLLRLYFGPLIPLSIYEITAERIDAWLDELKDPAGVAMQSAKRFTFKHELEVLSAVFRHYSEYYNDPEFRFPVKRRHWQDAKTHRRREVRNKDLTEIEFLRFRAELEKTKYGALLSRMATVQYYQALRISEAAGLYFEDVELNIHSPVKSRLKVKRSVVYPRLAGVGCYVKLGFKNSKSFLGEVKEMPLFRASFEVLKSLYQPGAKGLVFSIEGKPIAYRTIQHAYNLAFKKAGLPYTSTHVLRHGWTREVFNQSPDMDVAKQLLGDTSDSAARVYAVRRAGALTQIAERSWLSNDPSEAASGRTN